MNDMKKIRKKQRLEDKKVAEKMCASSNSLTSSGIASFPLTVAEVYTPDQK